MSSWGRNNDKVRHMLILILFPVNARFNLRFQNKV